MIRTQGLTHIHLVVRVFGLEERFREGRCMVFLNTPTSQDLITLNEDPHEVQMAGVNGGVNHFGFRLAKGSDLDAAVTEVEAAGGALVKRGEHAPGVPFVYIRDPDGYLIELLP
jgi:catechol 2,3-dioxygenase-like lactoylglutathione lyase family enzyme